MANVSNANMIESPENAKIIYGKKSSRAIQLTPKSRFRIINKFRVWRRTRQIDKQIVPLTDEGFHLANRKNMYSKSPYMIEYGEVERIQKKIDRVQEKIMVLLEERDLINSGKMVIEKKKKPLRLLPNMYREFNSTCKGYHIASANMASARFHIKGKTNSDQEEVTKTVDQHQQEINMTLQQEMGSDREALSEEEKEIRDTVEAHMQQSRSKLQAELEKMEINDTVETHLERTRNSLQPELEKTPVTASNGLDSSVLGTGEERVRPLRGFDSNIKDVEFELEPIEFGSDKGSNSDSLTVINSSGAVSDEIESINFNPTLTSEDSTIFPIETSNSVDSLIEFRRSLENLKDMRRKQIEKERASVDRKNGALRRVEESERKRQEMMDEYTRCATQIQQDIQTSIDREAEANKIAENATRQAEQNFADANELAEMIASISTGSEEMGRTK